MVAYLISRMTSIGQDISGSKASSRYLTSFHPRYTGWEITRTERAIEVVEIRARPRELNYSWDSPAVQVPHSDEDLFLHSLELRAQYFKQGKTLKSLQDSLTLYQRNAIEKLRIDQNRLLEEETIELEWHLAGIDAITPLVPSSSSSRTEITSLFIILKTGWKRLVEPAVLEHGEDLEGVHAFQRSYGDNLANGRPEERNMAYEHIRQAPIHIPLRTAEQPQARARARATPMRAPMIFVDSVADAIMISDNAPPLAPLAHHVRMRMHSRNERETAYHTSGGIRHQAQEYRNERQEREARPMEYQILGPNLAANYAKMPVRVQNRHIDTLIGEWDQVIECLARSRAQERYFHSS